MASWFLTSLVFENRIAIKKEEDLIIDSEQIYDTAITGGRVGMLVYAQPGAIFSKLRYECKERLVIHG